MPRHRKVWSNSFEGVQQRVQALINRVAVLKAKRKNLLRVAQRRDATIARLTSSVHVRRRRNGVTVLQTQQRSAAPADLPILVSTVSRPMGGVQYSNDILVACLWLVSHGVPKNAVGETLDGILSILNICELSRYCHCLYMPRVHVYAYGPHRWCPPDGRPTRM